MLNNDLQFSWPPLPPGSCHWEVLGVGIVFRGPNCTHEAAVFSPPGVPEWMGYHEDDTVAGAPDSDDDLAFFDNNPVIDV